MELVHIYQTTWRRVQKWPLWELQTWDVTWTVHLHPDLVMSVGPFALHFVPASSWARTDCCTHFVLEAQWRSQLQGIHLLDRSMCHWVKSEQVGSNGKACYLYWGGDQTVHRLIWLKSFGFTSGPFWERCKLNCDRILSYPPWFIIHHHQSFEAMPRVTDDVLKETTDDQSVIW